MDVYTRCYLLNSVVFWFLEQVLKQSLESSVKELFLKIFKNPQEKQPAVGTFFSKEISPCKSLQNTCEPQFLPQPLHSPSRHLLVPSQQWKHQKNV